MNDKIYTYEELQKIIFNLIEDYPDINKVILFGSYAENKADESSDIDIMIIGKNTFRGLKSVGFMSELKEALGKSVDMFLEKNIDKNSSLYKNILKKGIVLYE